MNDELKSFLLDAKNSITNLEELKKNINALKGKVTTFENKKKEFEDNIKLTINKALKENKDQINKSYDEIILEIEKRLKVSEGEKSKERKKNLDNLVEKNTRVNKDNNEYLRNEIKRILSDYKLPGFVNSNFYYNVFFPTTFKEHLVGFIFFFIFILGVPGVIWYYNGPKEFTDILTLIQNKSFWITLMYIALYLLGIGLIYVFIDSITKKDKKALLDIREIRRNIFDNEIEIKKITHEVMTKTKDEDFDYTKLDREIEGIKYELENAVAKKKEAIENFDNVTTNKIVDQVQNANKDELKNIEKELESAKVSLQETEKKHSDTRLLISEKYEAKIGKLNLTAEKIDLMINALNNASEEMTIETLKASIGK